MNNNQKICIAVSAGGHLAEALQIKDAWRGKEHFFISDKRVNALELAKKEKVHFILPARRSYLRALVSFIQTAFILIKENPDVIISTGAEIGYPALVLGGLMKKKTIYIETIARINSPSLCGKLVYGKVDYFFVQWKEGLKFFPKAIYLGAVI